MNKNIKASFILTGVYNLLEDEARWCKGRYGITGAPYCLAGSLHIVGKHLKTSYAQAYEYLSEVTGADNLVTWNDMPERTHVEVLVAIKSAIVLAKNKESNAR